MGNNFISAAKNTQTGEDVAIKKVTKVFEKAILAKRALREVKLLRHFAGHENVRSNINSLGTAPLYWRSIAHALEIYAGRSSRLHHYWTSDMLTIFLWFFVHGV